MSDKIYGLNEVFLKKQNIKVHKNLENSESFSKILESTIAKDSTSTGNTENIQETVQPYYINPLQKVSANDEAVSYVENNIEKLLSNLELFSTLMGKTSVDPEEIAPLAGKLKDDVGDILRYSEKNNIPGQLKTIVKESSALAYAAMEKLNTFT